MEHAGLDREGRRERESGGAGGRGGGEALGAGTGVVEIGGGRAPQTQVEPPGGGVEQDGDGGGAGRGVGTARHAVIAGQLRLALFRRRGVDEESTPPFLFLRRSPARLRIVTLHGRGVARRAEEVVGSG